MDQTALLLTATITPSAVPGLVVRDPGVRRAQYLAAFDFYLRSGVGRPLVLAENSGADLAEFAELAARLGAAQRVRLVSLPAGSVDPAWGRGSAELELVGQVRQRLPELFTRPVWKVTGRYQVRNIGRLVQRAREADLCLNLRRWPHPWCDLWVYGLTGRGLDALSARREQFREDLSRSPAEVNLAGILPRLDDDGLTITRRFPVEPRITGVRGYDGKPYESPRQRAKYLARTVSRRLLPALYI